MTTQTTTPITRTSNSPQAPAYYLGRPAHLWIEALRQDRRPNLVAVVAAHGPAAAVASSSSENPERKPVNTIGVTQLANSRYQVAVGRHRLIVDQPQTAGGEDLGPTAVQLFATGLVACTAHYAGSYLIRHGLSAEGLVVVGDFDMANEGPPRITSMSVRITPPPGLPGDLKACLLAFADHCTVHNTLRQPPTVTIAVSDQPIPAAANSCTDGCCVAA
jgi:uncharacterized OsmC-like protein